MQICALDFFRHREMLLVHCEERVSRTQEFLPPRSWFDRLTTNGSVGTIRE